MDWKNNPNAARNRLDKAKAIAAWCWNQGLTWEHLEYSTDTEWSRIARHAVSRTASDQTRLLVQSHLLIKEAWAAANPDHPQAARAVATPDAVARLKAGARTP